MQIFFLLIFCIFFVSTAYAVQTCKPDSIPASTPDSQFIDNNDNTITDLKTGLMWKKCFEGISGDACETGSADSFAWQQALQQPGTVNSGGGFAEYDDWRLPNIRELMSIVEEQCYDPAINLNRFPNASSSLVWSGSPYAVDSGSRAWVVNFKYGDLYNTDRSVHYAVRLVRDGQ